MKQRLIFATVLLTVIAAVAVISYCWPNSALRALEQTRAELRKQGFKIDLSEFDFSASAEQGARVAALTNADLTGAAFRGADAMRRNVLLQERLELMPAAGSDAAIVLWKQQSLPARSPPYGWPGQSQRAEDLWPALREIFDDERPTLDAGCEAALAGSIRFNLAARGGVAMLLPHLPRMKNLAQTLGTRAVLELHEGRTDSAWTNVLATTRLVTAWEPEPAEISQLVRCGLVPLAYDTTWQALQAGGWSDERLAQLQNEWQSVDLFKHLPETEAFARASHADLCQRERREPMPSSTVFRDLFRSPRNAWYGFSSYWSRLGYLHQGSYEDERALLFYHRDRELQLRAALQAPTWLQMRQIPAATNSTPFQTKNPSRVAVMLNMRRVTMGFLRGDRGLLSQAAQAEARRRVLMTAIALERYHGRHRAYPQTLGALVPELLPQPPVDFMDGQPLRYRLGGDGHFVLYSVGLDCTDNGGEMRRPRTRGQDWQGVREFDIPEGGDVVWPRPASAAEVQAQRQEEEREAAQQMAALAERSTEQERQTEAERRATIEKLLAEAAASKAASQTLPQSDSNEPSLRGRPFRQLLRNGATTGTNNLALNELLTPMQIFSTQDMGTALFEVPVNYDVVRDVGFLHLVIDGGLDVASRGEEGERQTCERATNGNCVLGWTSTYDPPGKHAVQAEFIATKEHREMERAPKARGPAVAVVTTNLCQFDSAYDHFDERGATLYAKLAESNGVYAIEVTSTAGDRIRSFTGTTSNGVIKVHWDLKDDHGVRCTNSEFGSIFKITLPDSGRSQTLKGP